jgi:hypothetical protein
MTVINATRPTTANVGAAAESLVVTRLLKQGLDVARPLSDNGIDFIAYEPANQRRFVPIQVKSASSDRINFERRWFVVPDLVLVYVWLRSEQCFVFDGVADVEAFLGRSALTPTWQQQGIWAITRISAAQAAARLTPFAEAWDKITLRLQPV